MKRLIAVLVLATSAWGARPTISNVQSTVSPSSCTVTWATNIGSDSLLSLSTGMGPYIPAWSSYPSRTTDTTGNGVTLHRATIYGLFAGTQYNIYLRSRPVSNSVVDLNPLDSGWYDGASNCNPLRDGSQCICGGNNGIPYASATGSAWGFQVGLVGPGNVVAGYDAYVWMHYEITAKPSNFAYGHTMTAIVSGYPNSHGETVDWYDPNSEIYSWNPATGALTFYTDGTKNPAFHIKTTATTPPGKYTITFNNVQNTAYPTTQHAYSYTLNVVAPPTFPSGTPASYPAIPGIGDKNTPHTWIWGMVTKGALAANCTAGSSGPNAQANFYDGIRALLQTKAYDSQAGITGNPAQWDICIADRENGYALYSAAQIPHGAVWAIYLGSKGLQSLALGGDPIAQAVLYDTSDNAQWKRFAGNAIDVGLEREIDFTTEAMIAATAIGHDKSAYIPVGISYLLGMVDQIVNKNVSHGLFLDGAIADTLIHYYEDTGRNDVRIPAAIKALADHLWTNYWIAGRCSGSTTGQTSYTGCFAYSAGMKQMGIDYATNGAANNDANLNPMIAPMYAWLFKMTGNRTISGSDGSQCALGGGVAGQPCTYQQAGDSIFLSGVQQADYWYLPKDWDQSFRNSFDYVTWRSQP